MTGNHITRGILTASFLTLPFAAQAADAPGAFKLPGTDTTMKIYGFVELNGTYDLAGRTSDQDSIDWASWIPSQPFDNGQNGNGNTTAPKNQLHLTAKTSRFGIQTITPSSYGDIVVVIEGDFSSPSPNNYSSPATTNGSTFRVRKAYGQIGNLLIGQTWSNFMDLDSLPDTVEFNVVPSVDLTRQPIIRYTIPFGKKASLSLAAEAPFSRQYQGKFGKIATNGARYDAGWQDAPDFTANYTYSDKWGHVSLHGVALQYKDGGNIVNGVELPKHSASGYGVGLSGHFALGNDTLVWGVQEGKGIGRYMLAGLFQSGIDDGQGINLWKGLGWHAGYTHAWSSSVRSNLIYSRTSFTDPGASNGGSLNQWVQSNQNPNYWGADGQPNKTIENALVNTFWQINKSASLGIEYSYGKRTTMETFDGTGALLNSGNIGTQRRINFLFHFNFF